MNPIVEKYEAEIQSLLEELAKENYGSEQYKALAARLADLQKLLNLETSRSVLLQKAEAEEIRVDLEHQKLEIERENLEAEKEKIKIEKKKPFWQIVGSVVTAIAGAGLFVFEVVGVIMANNSGESLPNALTKRIGSNRF